MATSTRSSTPRARTSTSRGSGTRSNATRTQATKKYPAQERPVPVDEPGLLSSAWLGLAHIVGGAARLFGKETLAKDERRDGVPFLLLVLAVAGAIVEWFTPATTSRSRSTRTPSAACSVASPSRCRSSCWCSRSGCSGIRRPCTTTPGIGIGLGLLLITISGLCHIFGGQPAALGRRGRARARRRHRRLDRRPAVRAGSAPAGSAVVVLGGFLLLSLFIITKTPPNKIGCAPARALRLPVRRPSPRAAREGRAPGETGAPGVRLAQRPRPRARRPVVDAVVASRQAEERRTGVRQPGRRRRPGDRHHRSHASATTSSTSTCSRSWCAPRMPSSASPARSTPARPASRDDGAAAPSRVRQRGGARSATGEFDDDGRSARGPDGRPSSPPRRPYRLPAASILARRHAAQGARRRPTTRRSRRSPSVLEPVPGGCARHRLQPRPERHALRGRARPRREGRARHRARQEPVVRGRVERGQHPVADPGQERDRHRDPEQGPRDRLARRRAALRARPPRACTR